MQTHHYKNSLNLRGYEWNLFLLSSAVQISTLKSQWKQRSNLVPCSRQQNSVVSSEPVMRLGTFFWGVFLDHGDNGGVSLEFGLKLFPRDPLIERDLGKKWSIDRRGSTGSHRSLDIGMDILWFGIFWYILAWHGCMIRLITDLMSCAHLDFTADHWFDVLCSFRL